MEITKEQFLEAYNKYPPSKWVIFAFKYFSKDTKQENKWLTKSLTNLMSLMFIAGFIGTVINLGRIFIGLVTAVFCLTLLFIGIVMGIGRILNNRRIGKIRKELGGISKQEYNILADEYFDIV